MGTLVVKRCAITASTACISLAIRASGEGVGAAVVKVVAAIEVLIIGIPTALSGRIDSSLDVS